MPHLTLAVFAELGVVLWAGSGAFHKSLPFPRFRYSVNIWFGLGGVIFPDFIGAAAHMANVDLGLFEAGRFSNVARRGVSLAIDATDRVLVMPVTNDVAHTDHIFRILVAFRSKFTVSAFRHFLAAT